MALQNLEFLLVIVEPFGTLAEAAFALPENNGRRLIERAEESSTSDVAVSARDLWIENSLILVRYSHQALGV